MPEVTTVAAPAAPAAPTAPAPAAPASAEAPGSSTGGFDFSFGEQAELEKAAPNPQAKTETGKETDPNLKRPGAAGTAGERGGEEIPGGDTLKPTDRQPGAAEPEPGVEVELPELAYFEGLAKGLTGQEAAPGKPETGKETAVLSDEELGKLDAEALRSQLKNAHQKLGEHSGELGTLRKLKGQLDQLKTVFEVSEDGQQLRGVKLPELLKLMPADQIREQLATVGLQISPVGAATAGGADPLDAAETELIASLAKETGEDLTNLKPDDLRELVMNNPALKRRLDRGLMQAAASLAEKARLDITDRKQARAQQVQQAQDYVRKLSTEVKHFKELEPVAAKLLGQIPADRPLSLIEATQLSVRLAEMARFPSVLKAAVTAAGDAREAALLKRLGLTAEDVAAGARPESRLKTAPTGLRGQLSDEELGIPAAAAA